MSIYDSVETYSKQLNMSLEQAKIRVEYFLKMRDEMEKSRKCPKCGQLTLDVESGEWESGISDWIYCGNDEIETVNDDGDKFYEECEFTDDVKNEYLFAFDHDFDVVLMMYSSVNITNEKEVLNFIGLSWNEFVENDTKDIMNENQFTL